MMTFDEIKEIVANCKYKQKGWSILVRKDGTRPFLQIHCAEDVCNINGMPLEWTGRKWFLSPHMCRIEIIRTAHKAVEAAVLHEMNEKFTYKGETIFDPHIDLDAMIQFRKSVPLDSRENSSFEAEMVAARTKVTVPEKKVILDKYLSNLRSGKYERSNGKIRSKNSFCALGIWYDTVDPEGWDGNKHRLCTDGNYTVARNWFGNGISRENDLVWGIFSRSDTGVPFDDIADWIENYREKILGEKS